MRGQLLLLGVQRHINRAMNLDVAAMKASADEAEALLKSLANRHRLMILCQLVEGERSVGDMAAFMNLRDSTVSQHLALLRKDGLVSTRRDGQTIWYTIDSEPAMKVLKTLHCLYCEGRTAAARRKPAAKGRKA